MRGGERHASRDSIREQRYTSTSPATLGGKVDTSSTSPSPPPFSPPSAARAPSFSFSFSSLENGLVSRRAGSREYRVFVDREERNLSYFLSKMKNKKCFICCLSPITCKHDIPMSLSCTLHLVLKSKRKQAITLN